MNFKITLLAFSISLTSPCVLAQKNKSKGKTKTSTEKKAKPAAKKNIVTPTIEANAQLIATPVGSSAKKIPIKLRQTSINALLIREITSGNYGASVSKLTVSVLPSGNETSPMITQMNQKVGPSMVKSFSAVNKGIFLKHNGWPKGERLSLGFADKHGGKDGPSAALAYSLLMQSVLTGKEIRKDIACTGDMNSDRTVQPIGGVMDKIRAAKKADCKYVLIPVKNVPSLMDAAIDGDIELLTSIQIISVENLKEAEKVAFSGLDEETTKALASYEKVQAAITANGTKALHSSNVFQNVAAAGKVMKNHQSAIIAAYYKLNRLPRTYSVIGSFNRLTSAMAPFRRVRPGSVSKLGSKNDAHKEAIKNLAKITGKVHPKMKKFAKAAKDYITVHREIMAEKNGVRQDGYLHKKFMEALDSVRSEEKIMLEDPEIKDSLSQ